MTLQQLNTALDGDSVDLSEINKKLAALIDEEEKKLTDEGEKAPEAEEPVEKAADEPAEVPEKAAVDTAEEEKTEPQEEKKELAAVESLFTEMTEKLEKLSAENARLQAKLEAKEKAEQDFIARFKNLSVSLSTESVTEVSEVPDEKDVFTDGIGEF